MSIGIYTKDFLFDYRRKSKNFECLNCKLVSPKNYFIQCKHCICQKCFKENEYKECPLDNTKIKIEGKNATAFQFIIINNLLNPFVMQCLFNGCKWAGKYQSFIENHYDKCKFRKNEKLLDEYFSNFGEKNKKKSKKNRKTQI